MEDVKAPAGPTQDDDIDILDRLSLIEDAVQEVAKGDDRTYGSLAEAAEQERKELEGVWTKLPGFDGAEVLIAHYRAAVTRHQDLERQYRQRKQKLPSDELPAKVTEELWNDAAFGTIVKNWRGSAFPSAFNLTTFREAMKIWRFRKGVIEKSTQLQTFRDKAEADLGKVSGSASGGA